MKLPAPISMGLLLSYQCNAKCRYCMYASSPKWKDWIQVEDLEKILVQLSDKIQPSPYGEDIISLNHGLHFTGGEPFLNFELLLKAVEIANELNIPSTFVETNCFWCKDDKTTKDYLMLLKDKGLKGILISVNPFYLEYVPFERTERGIKIAQEVFGENVAVYQLEYYLQFKRLNLKGKIRFEDYCRLDEDLTKNVELFLMGRAVYRLSDIYPEYHLEQLLNIPCLPPFIRSWHNHVDNYGNYIPGFCAGISLGDCKNLGKLLKQGLDLDRYPILKFLINGDFKGLLQFAKDFGYQELQGYLSKCHLCVDIRRYLVIKGEFEELKPKEFYSQLL
jgi:organic radical activating enzyme